MAAKIKRSRVRKKSKKSKYPPRMHVSAVKLDPNRLLIDDCVLSILEWCALNGFCERTGRRVIASLGGPVVTRMSDHRIGVTVRHNREWQAARALQVA
jgi:hypothetical protein